MSMMMDFKLWLSGENRDNFGFLLFRMIAKADRRNIEKLRLSFPNHVKLYENWRAMPGEPLFEELVKLAKDWGLKDE